MTDVIAIYGSCNTLGHFQYHNPPLSRALLLSSCIHISLLFFPLPFLSILYFIPRIPRSVAPGVPSATEMSPRGHSALKSRHPLAIHFDRKKNGGKI